MTKHLQTETPTTLGGSSKTKTDPSKADAKLTSLMNASSAPLSYRSPQHSDRQTSANEADSASISGDTVSDITGFRRATGVSDRLGTITLEQTHYHLDGARPDDIRPTHIPLKGGIQI